MAKGGAFERKVAKELSRWLTDGMDRTQLIRSEQSGGWTGARESDQGWRNLGDLAPNGPDGAKFRKNFAVECKHHKEVDFWWHFTRQPSKYTPEGWWRKLLGEIQEIAPECAPLIIFRANNRPMLVGSIPGIIEPTALAGGYDRSLTLYSEGFPSLRFIPFDTFISLPPNFYYLRKEKSWR